MSVSRPHTAASVAATMRHAFDDAPLRAGASQQKAAMNAPS
jgi:hypothetical protein